MEVDPDMEYINEVDGELSQQSAPQEDTIEVESTEQDSAQG